MSSLPAVIERPGSYVVSGNLDLATTGNGITITASDVVLDLGGHTLTALAGGRRGILIADGVQNVRVRNGTILGWINAVRGSFATDCRLSDVHTRTTNGSGIVVGERFVLERCTAIDCGSNGIIVGSDSIVTECTVSGAAFPGLVCATPDLTELGDGTSFVRCVSNGNDSGIFAGFDTRCVECTTSFNAPGSGIYVLAGSLISECTARLNDGDGIVVEPCNFASTCSDGTVIENCVASSNTGTGIRGVAQGSRVVGCTATGNLVDGIVVFAGSSVQDSTAVDNGRHGFLLPVDEPGSAVIDCVALRNGANSGGTGDGINAQAPCSIRGCTVTDSTDVGIYVGTGDTNGGVLSVVTDCTVRADAGLGAGAGIFVYEGASIARCAVAGHQGNGLDVGEASIVAECTAVGCGARGIFVFESGLVENSAAHENGTDGIWCGPTSIARHCDATENGNYGVVVDFWGLAIGCTASQNLNGIVTGGGVVLESCSGHSNSNSGIVTAGYCKLTDCSADVNGTNGIEVGIYCDIRSCSATGNTASGHAGIFATEFCSVRDCSAASNDTGIYAPNGFVSGCISTSNAASNYLGASFLGPVANMFGTPPTSAWSNQED